MKSRRFTQMARLLLVLGCALSSTHCASLHAGSATDALAQWRIGSKTKAVALSRAMFTRFLTDNELEQAHVVKVATAVTTSLQEDVVLTPGSDEQTRPTLDGADSTLLLKQIRRDLLGTRPTAVLKAIESVRQLRMRRFAPELIMIVYRHESYRSDGGLLSEKSPALRTLAIKWSAWRALRDLSAS